MNNNLILDYIRATTNLYGIIPLEKVVEIYNQQNEEAISIEELKQFENIPREYFEYFEGCFVHEAVFVGDSTIDYLRAKQGDKPYYIPSKEELLKFADEFYVEKTKEYEQLRTYIQRNIVSDLEEADELTEDIQLACAMDFSIGSVMDEFNRRSISFESELQVEELISLIVELANNTRIWENRGHTPNEIFARFDKPELRPLPESDFPEFKTNLGVMNSPQLGGTPGDTTRVGRNDPCPCGSGKKYKRCCLGKEK